MFKSSPRKLKQHNNKQTMPVDQTKGYCSSVSWPGPSQFVHPYQDQNEFIVEHTITKSPESDDGSILDTSNSSNSNSIASDRMTHNEALSEIERILDNLEPENIKAAKLFVRMEDCSHDEFLQIHDLQDRVTAEELKRALAQYTSDGLYAGSGEFNDEPKFELKRIEQDDPEHGMYEWEDESMEEEQEEKDLENLKKMFGELDQALVQKLGRDLRKVSKMTGLQLYLSLLGMNVTTNALTFEHCVQIHDILKKVQDSALLQ